MGTKMGTEEMKTIQTQLMSCVQGQMGDLKNVDAKQLGQVIDMVKDLSEAIYYCTITESMEKAEKQEKETVNNINYYTTPVYNTGGKMYPDYYRDMEREKGYMYYPIPMYYNGGNSAGTGGNGGNSGGSSNSGNNSGGNDARGGGTRGYDEPYTNRMNYMGGMNYMGNNGMNGMVSPEMMRDPRQGRAAVRRRMYMEGKEKHKDTNSQLKELEAYLQELSTDVTEMIKDASPEERATLHQKMTMLANKIN